MVELSLVSSKGKNERGRRGNVHGLGMCKISVGKEKENNQYEWIHKKMRFIWYRKPRNEIEKGYTKTEKKSFEKVVEGGRREKRQRSASNLGKHKTEKEAHQWRSDYIMIRAI